MNDYAVHVRDHVLLAALALAIALAIGVPLGAFAARSRRLRGATLGVVGIARVVPSLAILALALPFVGIGFVPSLIALAILAIPPIAINVDLGLRGVPAATLEAARGLGMSPREVDAKVAWPLALPVAFAGVRTAAVEVVASATLAAFIGGGGLGEYIVNGLHDDDTAELAKGAVTVAVLALGLEAALSALQRRLAGKVSG
jgi:osmoprotectant transport system permease protein